jgi:hypothetical protein
MKPKLRILGEHPLAKDAQGRLKSRIGTLFPYGNTLVTLPGIHATQRLAYVEALNRERTDAGQEPLSAAEFTEVWNQAVDLIAEDDALLIRPDPENMPLAFKGDEVLQDLVSKHKIKFLYVLNEKVREAIKRRGECWRVNPLPKSADEMQAMIAASRIGIGGNEIYYYNKVTGTRFLTCQQFAELSALGEAELRRYLHEIREFSARKNPQGNRELDFFMAGKLLSAADFAPHDFAALGAVELAAVFETLRQKFCDAVQPEFRQDDPRDLQWRNRMYVTLIGREDDVVPEEVLLGLGAEFFMQIEWLPGGRIDEGELIMDSIFEERGERPDDPELRRLCDEKSQKFIFNFVREFGDLEYVNLGRVIGSLSHRQASSGRRDVYLAEIKQRDRDKELLKIIRLQKWGVREHLDDNKSLLDAIIESEEYTEYTLDRRLGCRQLGMNLPMQVTARRIGEKYTGHRRDLYGVQIWSPYFERDYIHGMATDKIPAYCYQETAFALGLARLLGRAAAPNMIVGRSNLRGKILFDDGDEVLIQDETELPADLIVADLTGTFNNYRQELQTFAAAYATAVNVRVPYLDDPTRFAELYLESFVERFLSIQADYRSRKRAFDTLFKQRRRDPGGSFAFRWEKVLERLHRADAQELARIIAENFVLDKSEEKI